MGNSCMQRLTLKHFLAVNISVSMTLFEGFEGDAFFRTSPHANLKGSGSRATVTTKWGVSTKLPWVWVFWKIGQLPWQPRQELRTEYSHFEKDYHSIVNISWSRIWVNVIFIAHPYHKEVYPGHSDFWKHLRWRVLQKY